MVSRRTLPPPRFAAAQARNRSPLRKSRAHMRPPALHRLQPLALLVRPLGDALRQRRRRYARQRLEYAPLVMPQHPARQRSQRRRQAIGFHQLIQARAMAARGNEPVGNSQSLLAVDQPGVPSRRKHERRRLLDVVDGEGAERCQQGGGQVQPLVAEQADRGFARRRNPLAVLDEPIARHAGREPLQGRHVLTHCTQRPRTKEIMAGARSNFCARRAGSMPKIYGGTGADVARKACVRASLS